MKETGSRNFNYSLYSGNKLYDNIEDRNGRCKQVSLWKELGDHLVQGIYQMKETCGSFGP